MTRVVKKEVVTKGSGDEGNWQMSRGYLVCARRLRFGSFRAWSVLPWCSATCGCKSQCNGCMDAHVLLHNALNGCMTVKGALFCGGSRSTKPSVFPCKVAAAGDESEGYLVCVCGGCGLDRFGRNRFSLGVLQHVDANRIVMAAWMCTCCCKTHCNGCMTVEWALFWGGSRSTKPSVFPCKVAAAGDERYLVSVCGDEELSWQMRRHEMRWEELGWDELRWCASVKCGVRGVKNAVRRVRKVVTWRCIAPGSRAGPVLGQQRSSLETKHARTGPLAHGACKFYRWERSYSIP